MCSSDLFFHVFLHVLDNHDGIIHHQADGQHQGEKGQGVDGEIQQDKGGHGADKRNWHCQKGNDRSPPVLQEDEDDEHHEQQRLDEGFHDLLQGGGDEFCVILKRGKLEEFFIAKRGRFRSFDWTWEKSRGGDGKTYHVRFDSDTLQMDVERFGYATLQVQLIYDEFKR